MDKEIFSIGSSSSPDEINVPLMPAKSGVCMCLGLAPCNGLNSLFTAEWCNTFKDL